MINKNYANMSVAYADLAKELIENGNRVGDTFELNNVSFTLLNPDKNIPFSRSNKDIFGVSLSYMLGELTWYLSGDNSVSYIGKFGSLWKRISDDGLTNNSAYGDIIENRHNFNQLELVIDILSKDPNSRRAVININVPNPKAFETKDEPCTIALQFFIRNNKLNMTTVMRSNDIWFGTPYDIIYFTILQQIIALKLKVELGTYTHVANSFHVYDRNVADVLTATKNKTTYFLYDHINVENLYYSAKRIHDVIMVSDNPKEEIIKLAQDYEVLPKTRDYIGK